MFRHGRRMANQQEAIAIPGNHSAERNDTPASTGDQHASDLSRHVPKFQEDLIAGSKKVIMVYTQISSGR